MSVYLFAFCSPWSITLGQLAQLFLLLVTICIAWRFRSKIAREPLLWLTLSFVVYVVVRGEIAAINRPDLSAEHRAAIWDWVRAGPLPIMLMAWGISATGAWLRHSIGALLALVAGVLMTLLRGVSADAIVPALTGSARHFFGETHSVIGLCLVAVILCAASLTPSLAKRNSFSGRSPLLLATLSIASAVFVVALLVTKSRSSWIALIAAFTASGLAIAWIYRDTFLRRPRYLAVSVAGVTLMTAIIAAAVGDRIAERFEPAVQQTFQMDELLARGASARGASTGGEPSFAIRVAYLVFAKEMFIKAPAFGYGTADPRYLTDENPVPVLLEDRTDNLHSSYSQLLLSFGVVGGLPFILVFCLAVRSAWRLLESSNGARSIGIYGVGFVAAFAVWGIANQRLHDFDLIQLYATSLGVLLAGPCASRLRGSRASQENNRVGSESSASNADRP